MGWPLGGIFSGCYNRKALLHIRASGLLRGVAGQNPHTCWLRVPVSGVGSEWRFNP